MNDKDTKLIYEAYLTEDPQMPAVGAFGPGGGPNDPSTPDEPEGPDFRSAAEEVAEQLND